MDNFKKLGKDGLEKVWKKVFSLIKLLTGDVDVSGKGTLQEQINKKADSDHSHSVSTTSANGFMSSSDKSKLDGIASGANKYTHPTNSGNKHIPSGGSSGQILRWSADGTAAWGADNNTTYSAATASSAGLMSASDKSKLDGITASADSVSVSRNLTSGTKVGTITVNGTGTDLYAPTNTDTHYKTGLKVGASATATANAAASNGNVCLNVLDDTTVRDSHKIVGSGATTVTSDANGVITVNSTNTTYSAATTSTAGLMSSSDKTKLNGVATGAEVNQNAFSNVVVGSTTVAADSKTDTLTLAGSNVTLTPDATNDKVTIGITKANVTSALGYTPPTTNTTYSNATTSAAGLMSSSDKSKLDGIATGANKTTVDSALSSTSTNPVQNKVVNNALNGKAASDHNHDSAYIKSSGGSVAYGETKYTGTKDETFVDPATDVLCPIKISGNLAATTIYENGSKLSDKYSGVDHIHKYLYMNSIADFNNTEHANYRCMGSGVANCPTGYESQWFIGEVYCHNPIWKIQRFNAFANDTRWFERTCYGGTWGSWHADLNVEFSYATPDRPSAVLWVY